MDPQITTTTTVVLDEGVRITPGTLAGLGMVHAFDHRTSTSFGISSRSPRILRELAEALNRQALALEDDEAARIARARAARSAR